MVSKVSLGASGSGLTFKILSAELGLHDHQFWKSGQAFRSLGMSLGGYLDLRFQVSSSGCFQGSYLIIHMARLSLLLKFCTGIVWFHLC